MGHSGEGAALAEFATPGIRKPSQGFTLLSYGFGDFGINIMWGAVMGYLMYFDTEVCLLTARQISVIMLAARLIGIVGDILVGRAVDRRPDGSRVSPFLKWGGISFPLFFFLTFLPMPASLHHIQFAWSFLSYSGLTISYAIISSPYSVLINLVTDQERFRVRLATSRMIGTSAGIVVASAAFIPLADLFGGGDRRLGVPLAVALGAILVWLSLWATLRNCPERLTGHRGGKPYVETVRALLQNRRWIVVTLSMTINIIGISLWFGGVVYYAKYVLGLSDYYGAFLLLIINVAILVGSALVTPVLERCPLVLCLGVSGVASAAPLFLFPWVTPDFTVAVILFSVAGLFIGAWSSASFAILAQAADSTTPDQTSSSLGVPYSLNAAFIKGATSLGGFMLAYTMANGGFISGAASQPGSAVSAIAKACCLLPAIAFFLSGAVAIFYPRASKSGR